MTADMASGRAMGMAREDVAYIRAEMTTNSFRGGLRSMPEQLGLAYSPVPTTARATGIRKLGSC